MAAFMIHADLATEKSLLLRQRVSDEPDSNFVTITADMYTLPYLCEHTSLWEGLLQIWVYWVYSKQLPALSSISLELDNEGEYGTLMSLYELGVYLQDDGFQNTVTNAIIERNKIHATRFATDSSVEELVSRCYYSHVGAAYSNLRSLLVTLFANDATAANLGVRDDFRWPEEFLQDVVAKLTPFGDGYEMACSLLRKKEELGGKGSFNGDLLTCDFHVHSDGSNCDGHTHAVAGDHRLCRTCHPSKKKTGGTKRKAPESDTESMGI